MAVHPEYRERSFDCLLHNLMNRKRRLASSALWPLGEAASDAGALQREMAAEASSSGENTLAVAMAAMFDRDGATMPPFASDGSLAHE